MLVKFYSDVGGFTMFGDAAVKLIKLTGHTGTVPSAILPEDIPGAIARLEAALGGSDAPPAEGESGDDQAGGEVPVSLRQRAFPLLDLFKRAAKNNCEVLWDKA